jgi:hypothetical protein
MGCHSFCSLISAAGERAGGGGGLASTGEETAEHEAATYPAQDNIDPMARLASQMVVLIVLDPPRTGYLSTSKPLLEYMRSIPTITKEVSATQSQTPLKLQGIRTEETTPERGATANKLAGIWAVEGSVDYGFGVSPTKGASAKATWGLELIGIAIFPEVRGGNTLSGGGNRP